MDKDLAPRNDSPQKHGHGEEALRAEDFGDHIEGNFSDDEADDEEGLREVDVIIVDLRIIAEGVGEGVGDIRAVELEEDKEEDDEGHDQYVDAPFGRALLGGCPCLIW